MSCIFIRLDFAVTRLDTTSLCLTLPYVRPAG